MRVFRLFGVLVFTFLTLQGCASTQRAEAPPAIPPSAMFRGASLDDATNTIMNDNIRDGWTVTEATAQRLVFRKPYPLTDLAKALMGTNLNPERFLDRHYTLVTRDAGVMVYGGVNVIIRKDHHKDTSTPFPEQYPPLSDQLERLSRAAP